MCTTVLPFRSSSLAYPNICASCGDTSSPLKDTHLGMVCADCRRLCAFCEDWLLGLAVKVNGKEMHP
jgi:hypothetical protein